MDFLIAPAMPEHEECYYKYCEELFYELEAQEVQEPQEKKRYHSPEKPLGDPERIKRMRSEESVASSTLTSLTSLRVLKVNNNHLTCIDPAIKYLANLEML